MPGVADEIWYKDPRVLLRPVIVPDVTMSRDEQLNSILRFAVMYSTVLCVMKRSLAPLLIVAAVAALSWGMHTAASHDATVASRKLEALGMTSTRHDGVCSKPTLHNPFMNVLVSDQVLRPKRPKACDVSNSNVKRLIESYYAHNLYRDADDPLERKTLSRQFYTTPVTTIPGDQTAFAKWLYGAGPTCKQGNGARCAALTPRWYNV